MEETMSHRENLTLPRISWTPRRVLSPLDRSPNLFALPSIASMDNFYKCILYGRVLEHLFLRGGGKSGDVVSPSMQPNHRITYERIPQFDYILRICSLINAKHLNIYTNTVEETQFGAMSSQVAICSRRIPLDGCTLLRCSLRNFEYTIHSDSSSLLCSTRFFLFSFSLSFHIPSNIHEEDR